MILCALGIIISLTAPKRGLLLLNKLFNFWIYFWWFFFVFF